VWDWSLHPKAVHSLDPDNVGTVQSVHLGWKHTLAITQSADPNCPNESFKRRPDKEHAQAAPAIPVPGVGAKHD
jgi:hypothetical protein